MDDVQRSKEIEERRHVWRQRGMVFLTVTFWLVLWTLYLSLGSLLFIYLEAKNSVAIKAETRRNIEEKLHEIWGLGMAAGQEQRRYPALNDTRMIQTFIEDFASDSGLDELYQWDFQGGFHFCLTVVSTIGFGHLAPKTQIGQLVCIFYGAFGIIFNIKVMRVFGAITTSMIHALYRGFIAMLPKFFRVPQCCPIENDPVAATSVLVENQQTSAPTVPTNYRSDIYGNQSENLGRSSGHRAKVVWTTAGSSTKDHNHNHDESLNMTPCSSRLPRSAELAEHPTVVMTDDTKHDTIQNGGTNSHTPVWFVILIGCLWIALSSAAVFIRTRESGEDGLSILTCVYYLFVTLSTIGFGDIAFGQVFTRDLFMETFFVCEGLLALSVIFESVIVFGDRTESLLKSKCIICCKKRARKK